MQVSLLKTNHIMLNVVKYLTFDLKFKTLPNYDDTCE